MQTIKATLQSKNETTRYSFQVEFEENFYDVVIYLNEDKFIDDEISFVNGEQLDHEGEEGDIREQILEYLDRGWDKLVE